MNLSGGCLCGAVRFSGEAEPIVQVKCHCSDCRKATAVGHAASVGVPEQSVTFTGEIKSFRSRANSGRLVTRSFCPTCGSGVCSRLEAAAGLVFLCAGVLDDPNQFSPQMIVWTASAVAWDPVTPGIPSFPKHPEMAQGGGS